MLLSIINQFFGTVASCLNNEINANCYLIFNQKIETTAMSSLLFKKFIADINVKVPWYFFLGLALASIPVLMLGKSIRFYLAFISLQYFVVVVYISIKFIKEKSWKYAIASLTLCFVLFLSSGTLFGVMVRVLFYVFAIIICASIMVWVIEVATSSKNNWLIYLIVILAAFFIFYELQKEKTVVNLIDNLMPSTVTFHDSNYFHCLPWVKHFS